MRTLSSCCTRKQPCDVLHMLSRGCSAIVTSQEVAAISKATTSLFLEQPGVHPAGWQENSRDRGNKAFTRAGFRHQLSCDFLLSEVKGEQPGPQNKVQGAEASVCFCYCRGKKGDNSDAASSQAHRLKKEKKKSWLEPDDGWLLLACIRRTLNRYRTIHCCVVQQWTRQ